MLIEAHLVPDELGSGFRCEIDWPCSASREIGGCSLQSFESCRVPYFWKKKKRHESVHVVHKKEYALIETCRKSGNFSLLPDLSPSLSNSTFLFGLTTLLSLSFSLRVGLALICRMPCAPNAYRRDAQRVDLCVIWTRLDADATFGELFEWHNVDASRSNWKGRESDEGSVDRVDQIRASRRGHGGLISRFISVIALETTK